MHSDNVVVTEATTLNRIDQSFFLTYYEIVDNVASQF